MSETPVEAAHSQDIDSRLRAAKNRLFGLHPSFSTPYVNLADQQTLRASLTEIISLGLNQLRDKQQQSKAPITQMNQAFPGKTKKASPFDFAPEIDKHERALAVLEGKGRCSDALITIVREIADQTAQEALEMHQSSMAGLPRKGFLGLGGVDESARIQELRWYQDRTERIREVLRLTEEKAPQWAEEPMQTPPPNPSLGQS